MPDNPILPPVEQGSRAVSFATVWKALAVLAFAMLSALCGLGFTWGIWVTTTVSRHDTDIAVIKSRTVPGISQSAPTQPKRIAASIDKDSSSNNP